jgi:hypothetical protein
VGLLVFASPPPAIWTDFFSRGALVVPPEAEVGMLLFSGEAGVLPPTDAPREWALGEGTITDGAGDSCGEVVPSQLMSLSCSRLALSRLSALYNLTVR